MTLNTIRYAAYGYPMATFGTAAGESVGRWTLPPADSLSQGEWGTFRIEAGATWDTSGTVAVKTAAGTDITTINGAPTLIESLDFGEPYGELTGSLNLSIAPFDDLSAIKSQPGSNIDIWRVLPSALAATAGTAEVPFWHGFIASVEISDGPGIQTAATLQLMGALYGEASLRQHQPLMLDTASDVGTWAGRALDYALYSRPFTPFTRFTFESTTTGIDVRYRGSRGQSTIDYLDELLHLAQDSTNQWTIARAYQTLGGGGSFPRARHYALRTKQAQQASTSFVGVDAAGDYTWNSDYGLFPNNVDPTVGTTESYATVTTSTTHTDTYSPAIKIEFPTNTEMTAQAWFGSGALHSDTTGTPVQVTVRVYVEPGGSPVALTTGYGYPITPFLATTSVTGSWVDMVVTVLGGSYVNVERTDWTTATTVYVDSITVRQVIGIQESTVFMGGHGVAVSLSHDATQSPNAIYGEGVTPVDDTRLSGSRWRNAVYPMLAGTVPSYPSRAGTASTYPVTLGDTDGSFSTDVITQLSAQLRLGGWPDVRITSTFGSAIADAITAWKTEIGYANTNPYIGGTAEWAAVFAAGDGSTDLSSAWFKPLAVDPAVDKYIYTSTGDVAGTASTYDPNVLRVETALSYGENISKKQGTANAKRILRTSTPPVIGTITLMTDPVDESAVGRSRFDIREGSWIQLNNYPGGTATPFYIASVAHAPEAFTTTLTVSTRPFDLLDLATRIERNRAAKTDPAKSFYSQRLASTRPFRSAVGWDAESGAGEVPPFVATGSAWTVQKFVAGQYGQIGSLRVDTAPDVPYCFAVFGGSVSSATLGSIVSAPLGSVTGGYPTWWTHPDNAAALGSAGFIEAWGESGNAAGYYPGAQTAGSTAGTVTGALEDAGSWSFASLEPPWLWAAIWPQTSGTVTVKSTMRVIQDEA